MKRELYTSLTRLKMALNGGSLPPMTPLTDRARALLDPAFTIGMGALEEDPELGLRCPVRGCGKFFHFLDCHLNNIGPRRSDLDGKRTYKLKGAAHPGVSAADVRAALDIPSTVALRSKKAQETSRRNGLSQYRRPKRAAGWSKAEQVRIYGQEFIQMAHTPKARRAAARTRRHSENTIAIRNLRDSCDAQLASKLRALREKLGHLPTRNAWRKEYGNTALQRILRLWPDWQEFLRDFQWALAA